LRIINAHNSSFTITLQFSDRVKTGATTFFLSSRSLCLHGSGLHHAEG
jgi:hypothetical protein